MLVISDPVFPAYIIIFTARSRHSLSLLISQWRITGDLSASTVKFLKTLKAHSLLLGLQAYMSTVKPGFHYPS